MKKNTLLILGGKSDIGIAVAHKFAKEGFNIQLAARNAFTLKDDCSDINIRYNVKSSFHNFDALDISSHERFLSSLPVIPDVVHCAIGELGDQKKNEVEINKIITTIRINYEGIVSILSHIANHFQKRGSGTLICISSVAGDRGKASNYIYGSAKAGLTAFLSGIRNRLYPYGVKVITIKPGFVRTKMTAELKLPNILTVNPKEVANTIYLAYKNKKEVIYVKPVWALIMLMIKIIPESFFKKMKL